VKMLLLTVVGGFGAIIVVTQFVFKGVVRGQIVGWICLIFSLCVFVAPLGIVVSFKNYFSILSCYNRLRVLFLKLMLIKLKLILCRDKLLKQRVWNTCQFSYQFF